MQSAVSPCNLVRGASVSEEEISGHALGSMKLGAFLPFGRTKRPDLHRTARQRSRRGDDFLEAVGERLLVLNIRGHFPDRNRGRAYAAVRPHSHVINDPRQAKPVHGPARIFNDPSICAVGRLRSFIALTLQRAWIKWAISSMLPPLALEEAHRVERRHALTDLEVQLWRVDVAGLAGVRDHLPPLDLVISVHQQFLGMRVDCGVAIRVADQDEVAVARKPIACIADDAVLGGFDRRAPRAPRG